MKIKSAKTYILVGTLAVLLVTSIFLTIETAVTGATVANLEKKEAMLSGEKRDLEESLVKTLSNSELQEKSSELGFIKPATLVYVETGAPVAKLP